MTQLPAILLVDDDTTTNFLNQRLIQRLNVSNEVLVALNGQRALDMLHERCEVQKVGCPALVLLDVNMPVMNGFEFLETYSQRLTNRRHPVVFIMLTSSQLDQDLVRAQQLPVTDFLTKPLTREKLVGVLNDYFDYELPLA